MSRRASEEVLPALEEEFLRTLADEQRRYDAGRWNFGHTLRGRTLYRMAKRRGKLSPTHLPGRFNVEQAFQANTKRASDRLVRAGLLKPRPITSDKRPEGTFGYHQHQRRAKDLFLTESGRAWLVANPATPDAPTVPEPDGDLGADVSVEVVLRPEPPAVPPPDGDLRPAATAAAARKGPSVSITTPTATIKLGEERLSSSIEEDGARAARRRRLRHVLLGDGSARRGGRRLRTRLRG